MKRIKKNKSSLSDKPAFEEIDYSKDPFKNDPFFVKKRELAQRKLDKLILPKELLEDRK